jgi:dTDP-4-dehydrorhamnose reductase
MGERTAAPARVLITGAGAQLAAAVGAEYSGRGEILALRHAELDITDAEAAQRCVDLFKPTVIINCASYNHVDRAETEPESALAVNAFGVRVLARAAPDATLVHYSTDFVFDGEASQPYTENDPPNPRSVYAASKLLGEWFALESHRPFVLRVASLFGGTPAKSSVDRIVDALIDGREVKAFRDRTGSPSYVFDVAAATRALTERGEPGLYHCTGSGFCTWYELALEAARLLGREPARLIPVLAGDVPLPAPRPRFAALSNAKLSTVVAMPTWRDALERYIKTKR